MTTGCNYVVPLGPAMGGAYYRVFLRRLLRFFSGRRPWGVLGSLDSLVEAGDGRIIMGLPEAIPIIIHSYE
jgi:hypothetical protein